MIYDKIIKKLIGEIMEAKVREYKYDNLKFLMIFFVVFAHCLELMEKEGIPHYLYIFIYTFHMPMFIFISGYFSKFSKKNIINYFGIYIIYQTLYCLFDRYVLIQETTLRYTTPFWIMWYMFAIIIWTLLIRIFDVKSKKNGIALIFISVVISILAGFCDKIEYYFSLSRIITFFPYFLLGYYTKKFNLKFISIKNENGKINKVKIITICILIIITGTYFINIIDKMDVGWIYGVFPYSALNYTFVFKIMWFILSICELMIFYTITTNKKIRLISYIGANTLTIYLLHGFILRFLRIKSNIFIFSEIPNILLAFFVSILILIVLGNKYIKKMLNLTFSVDKIFLFIINNFYEPFKEKISLINVKDEIKRKENKNEK